MKIEPALEILKRGGLARACGVSPQATRLWLVIPPKHRDKVIKACKQTAKEARKAVVEIDKLIAELEEE